MGRCPNPSVRLSGQCERRVSGPPLFLGQNAPPPPKWFIFEGIPEVAFPELLSQSLPSQSSVRRTPIPEKFVCPRVNQYCLTDKFRPDLAEFQGKAVPTPEASACGRHYKAPGPACPGTPGPPCLQAPLLGVVKSASCFPCSIKCPPSCFAGGAGVLHLQHP